MTDVQTDTTTTNTPSPAGGVKRWLSTVPRWAKFTAVGSVALLVVIILFSGYNGVRNQGIDKENTLNALYQSNQNELSQYANSFYEQIGVVQAKSDKLDQIIKDAVAGRYDKGSAAVDAVRGGSFFSAVVEAYPNLGGLDVYDKVVSFVQSGREAFKNKQNVLLDTIRNYDTWRQRGIIHSRMASLAGFPSNRLEARIGTTVLRGQSALDQMKLIVTDAATSKAFQTGQGGPLTIPTAK